MLPVMSRCDPHPSPAQLSSNRSGSDRPAKRKAKSSRKAREFENRAVARLPGLGYNAGTMQLNTEILNTMLAILLPIALGYLLKLGRLFQESEIAALRKFVMRVALPFLIFQNLYRADVESLQQALPIVLAFILMTVLYTLAAGLVSPWMADGRKTAADLRFRGVCRQLRFSGLGGDRFVFRRTGPDPRRVFLHVLLAGVPDLRIFPAPPLRKRLRTSGQGRDS